MAAPATSPIIFSTAVVRPSPAQQHPPLIPLTAWDLPYLSTRYMKRGLLFSYKLPTMITILISSLSHALSLYYPLAGRLLTRLSPDSSSAAFFIHCNDEGAEFVHAAAHSLSVADLNHEDVPVDVFRVLFPIPDAVNHDGHSLPLLAVQLTELGDGFFLACSFNHVVGDGAAFWSFLKSWSEMARSRSLHTSPPPVIDRFFPTVEEAAIGGVPFTNPDEFIERYLSPHSLKARFFQFTADSIAKLKSQARREAPGSSVSSFQALSALTGRAIARAWKLPAHETITLALTADCRRRLSPPLPHEYFGNAVGGVVAVVTVGELLGSSGLGWAAAQLHEKTAAFDDKAVRAALVKYRAAPSIYTSSSLGGGRLVLVGGSPRFDAYGVDFGWGKAAAVRGEIRNRFAGGVTAFPAREDGGGVELEICLSGESMASLAADEEFMQAAGGL